MYGVIGLGGMGQHHVRIYSELGKLGVVYDVDQQKTQEFAMKYKVYGATSLDDFLTQKIIGTSVATPTPNHLQTVSKCLQNGISVLCEKPLASTLQDASLLINLADKTKTILSVGYIEKFNPIFDAVVNLYNKNVFGNIISVNLKRVGGIPRSADNVILDLMTHDFNLLINLLGKLPDKVYTHTHYRDNILDAGQVLLNFNSTSATCEANWISPIKIRQMYITGTKGYCEADLIAQKLTLFSSVKHPNFTGNNIGSYTQHIMSFNEEPLKRELKAFINSDLERLALAQEGYDTLALTLKALKEKQEVNYFLYNNVILGKNISIHPYAVIGKPPQVPGGATTRQPKKNDMPTIIGDNCIIGATSVIYQGCKIGENTLIGDGARLRDKVTVGDYCIIGMGTKVGPLTIIHNKVKIMDLCNISGNMIIEDGVFIAQGTMCANDKYMGRTTFKEKDEWEESGPIVRKCATIGMNSTLLPGIEIGENAIVAAGAIVSNNVLPRTMVAGQKAKYIRDIKEDELKIL